MFSAAICGPTAQPPPTCLQPHRHAWWAGRCFPCTRDLVELFLSQSADIVMAADFDGFPDFWKEPWFPPACPHLSPQLCGILCVAHCTARWQVAPECV